MSVPCTTKKKIYTDKDSIYELGENGKFWALHVIIKYMQGCNNKWHLGRTYTLCEVSYPRCPCYNFSEIARITVSYPYQCPCFLAWHIGWKIFPFQRNLVKFGYFGTYMSATIFLSSSPFVPPLVSWNWKACNAKFDNRPDTAS